MSEVSPNELVKRVRVGVRVANQIPTPLDPTLSHQGEAADAKATGDAINAVLGGLTINGKSHVTGQQKTFVIYVPDILMSGETGAQTLAEVLTGLSEMDADDIMYKASELLTVKGALDDIYETLDSELTDEQIEAILDTVFEGGEE